MKVKTFVSRYQRRLSAMGGFLAVATVLLYFFQNCAPNDGLEIPGDSTQSSNTSFKLRVFPKPVNGLITDDDQILCGDSATICTGTYVEKTRIVLSAKAAPGAKFDRWGGDCSYAGMYPTCNLVMNRNMTVTVSFVGGPNPTPTPGPSPGESPAPTPTPTPTPIPTPTPTPTPRPTPTPTPPPGSSPAPTPTAAPTPTPTPTPTQAPVTSVGVGGAHACAVKGGALFCWGSNTEGVLGDGSTTQRSTPVAVSGMDSGVTFVPRMSTYASCAIKSGGAYCWGDNSSGQNGNGGVGSTGFPCAGAANVTAPNGARYNTVPAEVSGMGAGSGVTDLAMGESDHVCAVKNNAVYCWGENSSGQLGINNFSCRNTPQIVVGSNAAAVSAGSDFTCAVVSSGVQCWGKNTNGQLGTSTGNCSTGPCSASPVWVSGLGPGSGVTRIASGMGHTCAVINSGEVRCWGANSAGQLGDGTSSNRGFPVTVSGLGSGSGVVAVFAGVSSTCAIKNDGTALCWGGNSYGQLGNGNQDNASTPITIFGSGSQVTSLSIAWASGIAASNGQAFTWGSNFSNVLGNGTGQDSFLPTPINLP